MTPPVGIELEGSVPAPITVSRSCVVLAGDTVELAAQLGAFPLEPPQAICGRDSALTEAVEAADAEAPGAAVNAAFVGADAGSEAAAADGLGVEEGHVADVCVVLNWYVDSLETVSHLVLDRV